MMSAWRNRICGSIASVFALSLLCGCAEPTPPAPGTEVSSTVSDSSASVATDGASSSGTAANSSSSTGSASPAAASVQVHPEFAQDIPGYPNATLQDKPKPTATYAYLTTRDKPEQIIRYYEQQLAQQGWTKVSTKDFKVSSTSGYRTLHEKDKRLCWVVATADTGGIAAMPSGTTPTRLSIRIEEKHPLPESVPLPPNADFNGRERSSEAGYDVDYFSYNVPGRISDVQAFYVEQLPQTGWQDVSTEEANADLAGLTKKFVIRATNNGQQLAIELIPGPDPFRELDQNGVHLRIAVAGSSPGPGTTSN